MDNSLVKTVPDDNSDWRDIPDYPGYQVNRQGTIRNVVSGYIYGQNPMLKVKGGGKWVNSHKLARIAFAEPAGADLPPVPSPFVVFNTLKVSEELWSRLQSLKIDTE
jgi:hypothetical protein